MTDSSTEAESISSLTRASSVNLLGLSMADFLRDDVVRVSRECVACPPSYFESMRRSYSSGNLSFRPVPSAAGLSDGSTQVSPMPIGSKKHVDDQDASQACS